MNYNDLYIPFYVREGAPIVEGKGVYLFDADGKKYLDCFAGIAVNALGYGNAELEKTISEQSKKLLHISNIYFNDQQIALAQKLVESSFADRVFFCNSGTEANEAAIKFARKYGSSKNPAKTAILSFHESFHGRTYAAMTATGQKYFHAGFGPLPQGFFYAPFNDIEATKQILDGADFAGILLEPIQAEGGITETTQEFMQFLRNYCDENDIVLIFDEIQCGMGRTGKLWAYEHYGITSDILTSAKPLGGGLPLGAVIAKDKFVSCLKVGDHGTTFGGNPLACALGNTTISIINTPEFLAEVAEKGEYFKQKLAELQKKHKEITGIFGKGLLIGVQTIYEPKKLYASAYENGLMIAKANKNQIRFLPPLIISKAEIDEALNIFEKVLESQKI